MRWRIHIPDDPSDADREAVAAPLTAFNAEHGHPADFQAVAILLKDAEGGTVGGLWGRTGYGWLFVELLFVPEALRGAAAGTALMDAAETVARQRGCVGAWLTTFAFQARGFYERRGYAAFGEIENSPPGDRRFFLKKIF